MQDEHARAWTEALVQEEAHQQELLATFRDELGAFARECAASLTALDAYVGGLSGLVETIDLARTGARHAELALDVARRLSRSGDGAEVYERLADAGDVEPRLVERARGLLRAEPRRTDRQLLAAVVDAVGIRARVERIVGPAPLAALSALRPLADRLPALATIDPGENEAAAPNWYASSTRPRSSQPRKGSAESRTQPRSRPRSVTRSSTRAAPSARSSRGASSR